MHKNTNAINSKKALEGTLCKLFGFKKVITDNEDYYLELRIKGKDFNVLLIVENLETIELLVETKKVLNAMSIMECRYNFNKLKVLVNRYKSLQ